VISDQWKGRRETSNIERPTSNVEGEAVVVSWRVFGVVGGNEKAALGWRGRKEKFGDGRASYGGATRFRFGGFSPRAPAVLSSAIGELSCRVGAA
jgi:hypothetical protein